MFSIYLLIHHTKWKFSHCWNFFPRPISMIFFFNLVSAMSLFTENWKFFILVRRYLLRASTMCYYSNLNSGNKIQSVITVLMIEIYFILVIIQIEKNYKTNVWLFYGTQLNYMICDFIYLSTLRNGRVVWDNSKWQKDSTSVIQTIWYNSILLTNLLKLLSVILFSRGDGLVEIPLRF